MSKSLRVAIFLVFTSLKRGNFGITLLTVLILAIVVLNLLFVPSLLQGLVSNANEKLKNTYSGDIVAESARDAPLIFNVDSLITKIKAISGVVAVTTRNNLAAEISFDNERTICTVYGILPEQEKSVLTINQWMLEGTYLDSNDRDEILLGIQLAGADKSSIELYSRSLKKVHAGDKIQVTYANGVKKTYKVKGIFYTEFIQTDLQALVSETEFETIYPPAANKASSIRVKIDNRANAASIIEQMEKIDNNLRILTWEDYAGIVRSMTDSFNVIDAILNSVNLLVAGITVFIITYIDVTTRRRQIGIQRAIGITQSSITLAYLMRAVVYAIAASIVASLLFTYIVIPLEAKYPFHFPFGNVYLSTGFSSMARATVILLCAAVVAALVPVWIASRIKILDAIWG
ncbi:MAG: FtsX-like permease family protein [Chloroflexota bacterium]